MSKRLSVVALAFASFASLASSVSADPVVFSTLPAGGGIVLIDDDEYVQLFGFVPSSSGSVDRLTLPLGHLGSDWQVRFEVVSAEGWTPGSTLGSFDLINPPALPEGSVMLELAASQPFMLSAGSMYFLYVAASDILHMFEGSAGVTGPMLRRAMDSDDWAPHFQGLSTPAFALSAAESAPVPEPGTLTLLATGAFGVYRAARRRRTGSLLVLTR